MNRLQTSINRDILAALNRSGLSKGQLAAKLKVHPAYVTKIVQGKQNFTMFNLERIAEALGAKLILRIEE